MGARHQRCFKCATLLIDPAQTPEMTCDENKWPATTQSTLILQEFHILCAFYFPFFLARALTICWRNSSSNFKSPELVL